MTEYNSHTPVMLEEVKSFAITDRKITYLDLTLGRAGHASELLKIAKKGSTFIGVDRDEDAIDYSKKRLDEFADKIDLHFIKSPYSKAIPLLKDEGYKGADFILMDIGVSSPQFDNPERGFSYSKDGPLDMRMDLNQSLKASDVINGASEKVLIHIFRDLGECECYYPVVKKIMKVREEEKIETTLQLVEIIKSSLPNKILNKKGHPAKQFFLGIRYYVNGEIDELKTGLEEAINFLNPKGRLVIISFNSEEDRIVKNIFNKYAKKRETDKYLPAVEESVDFKLLTRKPLVPKEEEINENNRSKPSILRAIERK